MENQTFYLEYFNLTLMKLNANCILITTFFGKYFYKGFKPLIKL